MGKGIIIGTGGTDTSIVTATASDVLEEKVIVDSKGNQVTGTIPSQGAITVTPETYNKVVSVNGKYMTGNITVLGTGVEDEDWNGPFFENISNDPKAIKFYSSSQSINKIFVTFEVSDPDGHMIIYTAALLGTQTTSVYAINGAGDNIVLKFVLNTHGSDAAALFVWYESYSGYNGYITEVHFVNIVTILTQAN